MNKGIARVLHEAGLYVSTVNPLLIKKYGNNSLRKVKSRIPVSTPGFSIDEVGA